MGVAPGGVAIVVAGSKLQLVSLLTGLALMLLVAGVSSWEIARTGMALRAIVSSGDGLALLTGGWLFSVIVVSG